MAKVKKHKKGAVFFEAALIFYFLQVYRRFFKAQKRADAFGCGRGRRAAFRFAAFAELFLKTWAAAALYAAVGKGAVGKKGAEAQERKIQK